jgi:predicted dehydrogenase
MAPEALRIGVIGAGGFGLFALQHFAQLPDVKLIGMAGTHREAAFAAAQRFGIPDIQEVDALLARSDVDLIYIATPPFLHYPQALKALQARKHVICEKPLALNLQQADELINAAHRNQLLLVANLMQRYNPLFSIVRRLIDGRFLGEFLHGYLENYASDEGLGPEHWFWDRNKSGGIFIEHGVHFFDLFEGWLGAGRVVAAQRTLRPQTEIEEQVQCTVRYPQGGIVNFYHGFTQPARLDRQEFRLLFERGDVLMEEWVPVRVSLRAVVDEKDTRELMELFPGARLDIEQTYAGPNRSVRARHKLVDVSQKIEIQYGLGNNKMHRYGELLRAIFRDQLSWIHDRNHRRVITEQNGRDSLALAVAATTLAQASSAA